MTKLVVIQRTQISEDVVLVNSSTCRGNLLKKQIRFYTEVEVYELRPN